MAFTMTEPKASAEDLLQVSFPILKWEQDEDGDLVVKGIATDGTVDSDEQIVDPTWSAKALNDWIATGGNVRQSHDPRHPVGKGLQVELDKDGSGKHWVKSVIVDPLAQKLVKKGVLTAYSIGISRPVIKHDPTGRARGGIILGGELAELSIVDRPSNKSSYLEIAKSAGDGSIELTGKMFADDEVLAKFAGADLAKSYTENTITVPDDMSLTFTPNDLAKILKSKIIDQHYEELALKALYDAEAEVYKRSVTTAERRSLAGEGHALSDGSYPIANAGDLHNAAHLAQTGHGNVEGAKRLIARRAQELGVDNPLNDSEDSEKGIISVVDETPTTEVLKDDAPEAVKEAEPEVTKDPEDTEAVDEPGNKAKKPKGKKMPPWLNKPDSDDDSKGDDDSSDCKAEHTHTEKCMPSGTPQSASGATDAAPMEEIPNKGPAPESPMPAGRKTPDTKGAGSNAELSAMLRFKTIGMDGDLGKLHDLTCPAYSPEDVAKYHPLADFDSLIDLDVWQRKAVDSACGPLDKAFELTQVWSAAQTLKSYDPAELNDFRLEAHKAFRDANPGVSSYPSPGAISPGKFNRGVISGGHAANSPGYDGPNSSPDVATGPPHAGSFNRPPLGSGHQTPSPSFMKTDGEYPDVQGTPTNLTYMHIEKDKARRALAMMHDHISHQFPVACPMIEQDAYRQPNARPVPPTEGIGKAIEPEVQAKAVSETGIPQEVIDSIEKGMRKKLGKKVLSGKMTVDEARSKMGRMRAQKMQEWELEDKLTKGEITREDALKALGFEVPEAPVTKSAILSGEEHVAKTSFDIPPAFDPEIIKSAIAEAIAPLVAKVEAQQEIINEQEARWTAKADEADPSTASWRGLALKNMRPEGVVKRAEIAERTQREIAEARQLQHVWRTSDNAFEREAARSELDKRGFAE